MLRNSVFFVLLWFSLFLSLLLFLPYGIIRLAGGRKPALRFAGFCTHYWGRYVLLLSGVRLEIEGREHLPEFPPEVILSNHQSYLDVPVLMSIFRYPLSFLAKRELIRIPLINLWLLALECDLIDRTRPSAVFRKIQSAADRSHGKTRLFFPEGTRSKTARVGEIHEGLIRMVTINEMRILPVHIQDSYKIFEEKGKIQPARVVIRIFPVSEKYDISTLKAMISGDAVSNIR